MLATLTQLKSWLSIDESGEDSVLTAALETASDMIAQHCNRTIEYVDADLTEQFDGGVSELLTQAWPIVSVASVKYSETYDFAGATAETADSDYHVVSTRGRIARLPLGTLWTKGVQCWQVVYRGGYWPPDAVGDKPDGVADLIDKFVKACLLQAAELRNRMTEPGYKVVEGLVGGAGNVGYAPDMELVKSVKALLVGERRV